MNTLGPRAEHPFSARSSRPDPRGEGLITASSECPHGRVRVHRRVFSSCGSANLHRVRSTRAMCLADGAAVRDCVCVAIAPSDCVL